MVDLILWFARSPTSAVGVVLSALGWSVSKQGGVIDMMDIVFTLLAVMTVLSFVIFLLWALPRTYHVVVIWGGTMLVSMLTMGWCLNNEQRCRASFIYTADTTLVIRHALEDFILKLYGDYRRF
jgi:hypothetical protein